MSNNDTNRTRNGDFQSAWENRRQWHEKAEKQAPDDATIKKMADFARNQPQAHGTTLIDIPTRSHRWIGYAAAASLVAGVSIIGITRNNRIDGQIQLPVAKEVNIGEGQTIRFLCNDGCTAKDVLLASKEVINNN